MRVVVISHTYIVPLNRRKLCLLRQLNDNIDVRIVVPSTWIPGGVQSGTVLSESTNCQGTPVVALPNFARNHQGLMSFGSELVQFLGQFRPQIIQVEQGSRSLCYAQCIFLNKLLGLQARNVFFTWWNLPYQTRFPLSAIEGYNLANTSGLIAGNRDAVDILRQHGYSGAATVMPQLGVDQDLFNQTASEQPGSRLGFQANDFIVGFIGRFVAEKGIERLLEAVSILSRTTGGENRLRVLMVGKGPLKELIQQRSAELPPGTITIAEDVPHTQVPDYLKMMNVLVLPSQTVAPVNNKGGWKEQFGHVLIEAMSCGIPVIGSDSGEIPNVIGDAGFTFPEQDALALSHRIDQLRTNENLRSQLALSGRQRVLQHYTDEVLAGKLLQFWTSLLANQS